MRLFLLLPLILWPFAAQAQETSEELWVGAAAAAPVAEGVDLQIDAVTRFSPAGGPYDFQASAGFQFDIGGGVKLMAGYRHGQSFDQSGPTTNEERARQQISGKLGKRLAWRLRAEQRWRNDGEGMGLRIRPQIRYNLPLGDEKAPALFVSHEDFINLDTTDWGQRAGYERMRNALGVSVPLSKALAGEVSYLNQYRFGRDGERDQMAHALSLTLSISL